MRDSGRKCEISGSIIGKLSDPAARGEAGGFFEVAVEEGVVFEAEEFADLVDCVLAALEEAFGFEDYVFGDQGGGFSAAGLDDQGGEAAGGHVLAAGVVFDSFVAAGEIVDVALEEHQDFLGLWDGHFSRHGFLRSA